MIVSGQNKEDAFKEQFVLEDRKRDGLAVVHDVLNGGDSNILSGKTYDNSHEYRVVSDDEAEACSCCGKIITSEIYTDRFYEILCLSCLLRIHKM